jgi:hypothetical protein
VAALEAASARKAGRRQLLRIHEHGPRDGHPGQENEQEKRKRYVPRHAVVIGSGQAPVTTRMGVMDVLAIVLLFGALVVLVGAEWPRLGPRLGIEARAGRARARRKRKLRVVGGERDEDFVASVQRDLEDLPVVEERDDRQPR